MSKLNLDSVSVALGDPVSEHRRLAEGILRRRGFNKFHFVKNTSEIEKILVEDIADLLVCDLAVPEGNLDDLIRQVRHGNLGSNPFLVTIIFISDPTKEMIRECVDSGSDSVLLKPYSENQFLKHLTAVMKHRKPFVVTYDYIGPNRRKEERPDTQQIPMIDVPNLLQDKLNGELDNGKMKQKVEKTMKVIHDQKLERGAYQIGWLAEKIMPLYIGSSPDKAVMPLIEGLVTTSEDINRHMEGLENAHASGLCQALRELAGRLQENPLSPEQKDLEKLPNLAQEIRSIFELDSEAS